MANYDAARHNCRKIAITLKMLLAVRLAQDV